MAETSPKNFNRRKTRGSGRARGDELEKTTPLLQTYGNPPLENVYLHFLMLDEPALD
jgi:hypothetical protein